MIRHPSIRLRLIVGTTLLVTLILGAGCFLIYQRMKAIRLADLDDRLLDQVGLLSKSTELIPRRVIHKWRETTPGSGSPVITGLFQFWEWPSGTITRSPDLGEADIPYFHGKALPGSETRDVVLSDGRPARATSLRYLPRGSGMLNEYRRHHGEDSIRLEDHPIVVIAAIPTGPLLDELAGIRILLAALTALAAVATCGSIAVISRWSLAPIDHLTAELTRRSGKTPAPLAEIPSDLPGELTGLAGAFNRNLEQLEGARLREKRFASSAAHELRTPIAGIQAILEQALHRPRSAEDLVRRIGKVLHLANRTSDTLSSLIRLSRVRNGFERPSSVTFMPLDAVRDITEGVRSSSASSHVVEWIITGDVRPITTDEGLFRILVGNVVENAFRHSPEGGVIVVGVDHAETGFLLAITNGRGNFQPSDAGRVFLPFERGSLTPSDLPGAGLGLPLAREISRLLGGSLELDLSAPETLTFRIQLSAEIRY